MGTTQTGWMVGIVGIVGIVGKVEMVGINFLTYTKGKINKQ